MSDLTYSHTSLPWFGKTDLKADEHAVCDACAGRGAATGSDTGPVVCSKCKGKGRAPDMDRGHTIRAGDVVRLGDYPYDCATVLGLATYKDPWGTWRWWAKLARPYAQVSCPGTTCPTPLLGCEVFEVEINNPPPNYRIVRGA